MDVYNQFVNPTTSLLSLYCNFVSKDEDNLIVSKGNLIQVFKIVDVSSKFDSIKDEKIDLSGYHAISEENYKLILVTEYTLNGIILDMHRFRTTGENVDYLLISTEPAKISLVKWNPADFTVSVVSLHYYETVLNSLLMEKLKDSVVSHRTDPNFGCSIMQVEDLVVFLPFVQVDHDMELNDDYDPLENSDKTNELSKNDLFEESFIVNASTLHHGLKNIIDIQFLNSYRSPTLAILYAPDSETWAGYLPKRKDNLKLIVLSLHLKEKSANVIIEINSLPYDLYRIVPLDDPINGLLIVGANEIIHINSLGSPKGIYVNEFYCLSSSFPLKSQQELNLFLEHSAVAQVGKNEVLLVTKDGEFYTLIFDEIGGVSNLNRIVSNSPSNYADISVNSILSIETIPHKNMVFMCSRGSDSVLVKWEYRLQPTTSSDNHDGDEIVDTDDDFWLYNDNGAQNNDELSTSLTNCKFTMIDALINTGPLSDFTFGYSSTERKLHGLTNPNYKECAIYGTSGLGKSGSVSIITPTAKPLIKSSLKFSHASKIWTINSHDGETKYLITTDQKMSRTQIFEVSKDYQEYKTKAFRGKHFSVQFGSISINEKIRPVQIIAHEVLIYNLSFGFICSLKVEKEVNLSIIYDNYIVLLMKTGEIEILEYDDNSKELARMDLPALLNFQIFTNAWITKSDLLTWAVPAKKRDAVGELVDVKKDIRNEEVLFWLVTADNRLLVFRKEHLEKVYEFEDIHNMPEYLQLTAMNPNYEADVDPILKQCIFTQIGDKYDREDYMIILTFGGEVIMYQLFYDTQKKYFKFMKANDLFQLPITGAPGNSYSFATKVERNLFKIDDVGGSSVIMVSGALPFIIYKQYNSVPRMFKFTSMPFLYFAPYSTNICSDGIITIDDKKSCRMVQLDFEYDYSNKLPIKKCKVGETIDKIAYHEDANVFLVSTISTENYNLLDEEGEDTIDHNRDLKKPAQNYRGAIKLLSPGNLTVIDTLDLDENEVCTALNVSNLRINGTEGKRAQIFVGTGIYQNEDVATMGAYKYLDIINVVPEPGFPEAKHKLKLLSTETYKGPILDVCEVDGRFAVIQGQRMLVRQLKGESNSTPVAFVDTSLFSSKVKAFENFILIGDSYQSVSLHGFEAEPYRMVSLGKDEHNMKLNECEFIVHNQSMFILASDDNRVLHILQYDPYDVNSLKGHKLLRRTALRTNSYTTKMLRKDRREACFSMVNTLPIRKDVDLGFEVIGCNIDGSIYKVSPINEYQYRRLYSLQNQIADKEAHWLGLNAKMNAVGDLQDEMNVIKRPIIEYRLLTRFSSMAEDKKKMFAIKLGKDALVDVYRDMISLQ